MQLLAVGPLEQDLPAVHPRQPGKETGYRTDHLGSPVTFALDPALDFRCQGYRRILCSLRFGMAVLQPRQACKRRVLQRLAESKLLADSQQLCIAASQELKIQYQERAAYAGDPLKNLPRDAQEISLMGISATVLKAYKGIKGGMFLPETGRITGYTYPTAASGSESELTEIERIFIRSLANRSAGDEAVATQSKWYDRDLIVGAAVRSGGMVLWTMRRVPVLRYPLMGTQRWWLAALVFSTVLGVGGIISIWYRLHSGVAGLPGCAY